MQQRQAGYMGSAQEQGATEQMIARRNYLQDRTDFLDDLRQQRVDLMRDVPALIRQRKDYLSDQKFDQGLAQSQLDLNQLIADRDYNLGMRGLNLDANQQSIDSQAWSDWFEYKKRQARGGEQ